MTNAINVQLPKYQHEFRNGGAGEEARFAVLMALWGHANIRNRAWPSIRTLCEERGFSNRDAVCAAFAWLVERGAIYEVPIDNRLGDEPKHKQIRV